MTFEKWLAENGYDADKLTVKQRAHLTAAWQAETSPPIPVATPVVATPEAKTKTPWEAELEAANREADRRSKIDELASEQVRANVRYPERIKHFEAIRNAAIEGGWDINTFQLELLKAKHQVGPIISVPRGDALTSDVLEAAALRSSGYRDTEKLYSDQVLSAADKRFRRGIGARELFVVAAEHNSNYRGSPRDTAALCRAAIPDGGRQQNYGFMASASTIDVAGILSTVANKQLERGFLNTDQGWRGMARIVNVTDYKERTFYRLGGDTEFEIVPRGGEIKHGTLNEQTYGIKVDSYAKMLGIDEQDIRNDDLNAFGEAGMQIGRGGGEKLNNVFWNTHFLADHATFFPTDNSLKNYVTGSTSVLSLAGLDLAETAFRLQTKPDGTLLGVMPMVIAVPAQLYNTALQLMGGPNLVVGTTPASGPNLNVFMGRYRIASSAYMDTTGSSVVWYMMADPETIATICVGFLDGIQTPTVETSDFDFNRLGLSMRGVLRFGVRKHEYRGAVKVKGAS